MNKGDLFNTICEQYSDEDMKVSLILAKISAKLSAKRLELQMNQSNLLNILMCRRLWFQNGKRETITSPLLP